MQHRRTRPAPRTASGTLGAASAGACSNSAASALVASFFTPRPPALAPGFFAATNRGLAASGLRAGAAPARAQPASARAALRRGGCASTGARGTTRQTQGQRPPSAEISHFCQLALLAAGSRHPDGLHRADSLCTRRNKLVSAVALLRTAQPAPPSDAHPARPRARPARARRRPPRRRAPARARPRRPRSRPWLAPQAPAAAPRRAPARARARRPRRRPRRPPRRPPR